MMDRLRRALLHYAPPEMRLALRQLRQRVRTAPGRSPFPTRHISSSDRLGKGPALILAPHPDDEVSGAGGALAFADPDAGLGFAYVMNAMQFHMTGGPPSAALVEAAYDRRPAR